MQGARNLIKTLTIQEYLKFYEIMKYPVPKNTEVYFQYSESKLLNPNKNLWIKKLENNNFSWDKKSKYMDEYLNEIKRLKITFQSIPFVEEIYLCNSITFNALDENSDIDLFIIAEPWRIRTVKFRSMILFTLKWAKRIWKRTRKKICLSFFITSNQQNLYPISLPSMDIYLAYWIAHLVLIYKTEESPESVMFTQNKWVKWILPNYQEKQTISLWIDPFTWNTKFKDIIETLWGWLLWNILFLRIQKYIFNTQNQNY